MMSHTHNSIPRLRIPRHPLWVEAYDGAWALCARALSCAAASDASPDDCMIALFARYAHEALPLADWLDHFHIADTASPLLAWAEWELYQVTADADRLARVLPNLIQQYEWRKAHRRRASGLYWQTDETTNALRAAHEWVDRSAQQALAAQCIAQMVDALRQTALAQTYRAEWQALCALINQRCWDDDAHFYFDRRADGSLSDVKTVAGLWPLTAGVPSAAQAAALAAHLSNPQEFWRVHVFPSLSADHPRYADRGAAWRGSVWPLPNYALVKGLERYGLCDLAFRAADNHITTISQVHKETDAHWDNYAPDYIEPGSIAQPDSLVACIGSVALLLETILGLRVDAPEKTLHWRPRLPETYHIEQLRCGAIDIHLAVTDGLRARITTSAPFTLHLITPTTETRIEVADEAVVSIQ